MDSEEKTNFVLWYDNNNGRIHHDLEAGNIVDARVESITYLKRVGWTPETRSKPYIAQHFDLDINSF